MGLISFHYIKRTVASYLLREREWEVNRKVFIHSPLTFHLDMYKKIN